MGQGVSEGGDHALRVAHHARVVAHGQLFLARPRRQSGGAAQGPLHMHRPGGFQQAGIGLYQAQGPVTHAGVGGRRVEHQFRHFVQAAAPAREMLVGGCHQDAFLEEHPGVQVA